MMPLFKETVFTFLKENTLEDFYNNSCCGFLNPEAVKERHKIANGISYSFNKKTVPS